MPILHIVDLLKLGQELGAKQPRPPAIVKSVPKPSQQPYKPTQAPSLPGFGRIFQWPTRPNQRALRPPDAWGD